MIPYTSPKLLEEHLRFFGLFTCMMQLRAVNCFDIFARTRIILFSSLNSHRNDISEKYRAEFFWDLISKDINFQKCYIRLVIKLSDAGFSLCRSINHALDAGYFDLLRDCFNSMSKERVNYLLDNCEQWEKPVPKSTLIMFCTDSEYKKNLSNAAMKAISIKIDDKNLSGSINELLNLQSNMNSSLNQWIQELRDREALQNRSQISYGIRPK